MGTDHLGGTPNEPTVLSDDEVVENMIDWLEEAGFGLLPWQANALRAILLQEHIMTPDGHRVPIPRGYTEAPSQRRGFESTQVLLDAAAPRPGMVRVLRDGEWVWENPCTCVMGYSPNCPVDWHRRQA